MSDLSGQARLRGYGGRLTEGLLEWIPYLEKEMLALRLLVPPGGVCVEAGAAGGTYAYLLSRLVGESGHVYALEPRPASARFLERARRIGRLGNVSVHQLALSEDSGTETLLVPRRRGIRFSTRSFLRKDLESGSTHYPEFTSADQLIVECVPLDLFAERHDLERLDFLKLDVEGAELWVLRGGAASLKRHRPTILCEIERRHLQKYGLEPGDVVGWLADLGYRPYRFTQGRFSAVEEVTDSENNYLFVQG